MIHRVATNENRARQQKIEFRWTRPPVGPAHHVAECQKSEDRVEYRSPGLSLVRVFDRRLPFEQFEPYRSAVAAESVTLPFHPGLRPVAQQHSHLTLAPAEISQKSDHAARVGLEQALLARE